MNQQNNTQDTINQLAQVGFLPPSSIRLNNQNSSFRNKDNNLINNGINNSCNFNYNSSANNLNDNVCNISNKNINLIAAALNSSLKNNDVNIISLPSTYSNQPNENKNYYNNLSVNKFNNMDNSQAPKQIEVIPWVIATQDSSTQTEASNKLSNKINVPNSEFSNEFKIDNIFLLCPCCNHKLKLSIDIKGDKTGIKLASLNNDISSGCSNFVAQSQYEKDSVKMILNNNSLNNCNNSKQKNQSFKNLRNDKNNNQLHNLGNKPPVYDSKLNIFTNDNSKINLPNKKRKRGERRIIKCNNKGCECEFDTIQDLNNHLRTHKTDIFECTWDGCRKEFNKIEELCCHFRNSHSDKSKAFKCPCCDKSFVDAKQLRNHYRLHTDERPYSCDWDGCGARFRRCHHLTAHKRIHTGEKPYHCDFLGCNEKFSKSFHLKKHHLSHMITDNSFKNPDIEDEASLF